MEIPKENFSENSNEISIKITPNPPRVCNAPTSGIVLDLDIPQLRDSMSRIGVTTEFESMSQAQRAFKKSEDKQTRAATEITNPSILAARKFTRTSITECNSWLTNRLRKEPQGIELMVQRWNEIFKDTCSAGTRTRDT